MSVTLKTLKMLWGRAAGRCSFPDCRLDLVHDDSQTDDSSLVGENCHIVAESNRGPRADASMPESKRNLYQNLILMCRVHHKVIDDTTSVYSVNRLHEIKRQHENWVEHQLGWNVEKQREDELYADIMESWERLAHIDEWSDWSSFILFGGQPSLNVEVDNDLEKLRKSLLKRIWPSRYPQIKDSFDNFALVLNDFQECFRKYAERVDGALITRKIYNIDEWSEEKHFHLLEQYNFQVDLVQDLMLELTRAANLVCDVFRLHVMPDYRLSIGRLTVQSGPSENLSFREMVPEYGLEEKSEFHPYPGFDTFLDVRSTRDFHFGKGHREIT